MIGANVIANSIAGNLTKDTSSRAAAMDAKAEKVARDFEAMFIGQMLEHMFGDSLGDDLFGGKDTSEIYRGIMVEQYGKQISAAGGIGIADYIKRELLHMQEVKS